MFQIYTTRSENTYLRLNIKWGTTNFQHDFELHLTEMKNGKLLS